MRLLVFGHWSHTGFGVVTEQIGAGLLGRGHDVRVLAGNHRGQPIRGPLAGRVWPVDVLRNYIANVEANGIGGQLWSTLETGDEWKPDAVLVIADVSGLLGYLGKSVDIWRTLPVFHYCPIEGDNLTPMWQQLWSLFHPVAMSDYGQRVISEHIGKSVPRIYHGVDTEAFFPVSASKPIVYKGTVLRSKEACKDAFGWDTRRKVILRADRNVVRKNYDALIRAFTPIAQADPDVDLVLHCQPVEQEGIDLVQEILRMPEPIRGRVRFTNMHDTFQGLPTDALNVLYNAADVYMTTTGGEGFGLTLAESLACGVPVVTTGWAAEIEVVGPGGIIVPPLHDSYGQPVRNHSRYGMDWAVPDPAAFVAPVIELLARPSRRRAFGAEGRIHVARSFNWDVAVDQFSALLIDATADSEAA